jgi:hypothetical protein
MRDSGTAIIGTSNAAELINPLKPQDRVTMLPTSMVSATTITAEGAELLLASQQFVPRGETREISLARH